MNLKVKVNNAIFHVKIISLSERPVRVEVDGETFEVWPESNNLSPQQHSQPQHNADMKDTTSNHQLSLGSTVKLPPNLVAPDNGCTKQPSVTIRAPIPGVITAITTEVGVEVSMGQELCKLEAMKMNNSIRSNRDGVIGAINVSIGQHVKHNDVLLEFLD